MRVNAIRCKRYATALLAVLFAFSSSTSVWAANAYDLSSRTNSVTAPANATIRVGHTLQTVTAGQQITPAELAALNQVLTAGHQSLIISGAGNAVAGRVNIGRD